MLSSRFKFKHDYWDYLVILDACRFDFFSHFCKHFFEGNLSKVLSLGSQTMEWCVNTFREYYNDVIYVSANAYINSICEVAGFDAKRHFYKVVDVWHFGWNEELGTVHPEAVTKAALSVKYEYPNRRFIIHFAQPHAPYISEEYLSRDSSSKTAETGLSRLLYDEETSRFSSSFRKSYRLIYNMLHEKLGLANLYTWKLRAYLGVPPATPLDATRRRFGINGLRRAYAENLRIVLGYVAFLASRLPGKVVITSDHGELLGEKRMFDHPAGLHNPILRIVPWFEITSVKERPKDVKHSRLELDFKILQLKQKLRMRAH